MITLREYQNKAIEDIRAQFRLGKRAILLQMPTGAGKTLTAAFMIRNAVDRGLRVYFLAHRDFLLEQTSDALSKIAIDHGVISPAYHPALSLPVQVASIQTLARRLDKIPAPDLVIVDECHRVAGSQYRKTLDAWPRARVVGLSASPKRLDGKPLSDVFEGLVTGPTMRELIQLGNLSDYDVYIPPSPGLDLSGVSKKFGDYVLSEAAKRVNKPTITGSAVEHYKKLLAGKRAIVFAASIEHSKNVVEEFNAAGVPALHVDGETSIADRRTAIDAFGSGRVKILSNVNICVEGFDLPACEGVILLRPTQSLVIFLQAIGRALRPAPGKDRAIVLDHVGATLTHGLPCEPREWDLDGSSRSGRKNDSSQGARARQCPACYLVHEPFFQKCPACGHTYEIKSRIVEETEGELRKASKEELERTRKEKRVEVARAKTLEELIAIGKTRGYANPAAWAGHVFKGRRRVTA